MATTPEGKVKEKVKKLLTQRGAYWYMPMGTAIYTRNGVPDFLVCYRSVFIGIETKAGYNKPSALQKLELINIKNAGGIGLVVNEKNLGTIENVLEAIDSGNWTPALSNFDSF